MRAKCNLQHFARALCLSTLEFSCPWSIDAKARSAGAQRRRGPNFAPSRGPRDVPGAALAQPLGAQHRRAAAERLHVGAGGKLREATQRVLPGKLVYKFTYYHGGA